MENKILKGAELKEFAKQFHAKVTTDINTEINKLGTAAKTNTGLAEGNVPVLEAGGKLNVSVLPAIAIDTMITVENRDAALASDVQNGDFVRITEDVKVYMVIDDSKTVFEEKFVPLSSVTDSITRGEIQTLLDEKVSNTTYAQDKATLEASIATKLDKTTYDTKIQELETSINAKLDISTYTTDKDALNTKIADKATELAVQDNALVLKKENGVVLSSVDLITTEDITAIIEAL